jgi:hypothetical protein
MFRRNVSSPSSGDEEETEQEINVKAGFTAYEISF